MCTRNTAGTPMPAVEAMYELVTGWFEDDFAQLTSAGGAEWEQLSNLASSLMDAFSKWPPATEVSQKFVEGAWGYKDE